jgi:16S rRNA (guanine527-N7)-methyltransferase
VTSREFRDRVRKLAKKANVIVAPELIEPLEAYYRLLAKWNEKMNLTALPLQQLEDDTVERLLIEPLAAARFVPDSAVRWFDLGSGGGSPAIPLKLARRALHLTMIEAKARKAAFLREAVRALGLPTASVENVRFEALGDRRELRGKAAFVTVRAVRIDEPLVRVAQTLLTAGGSLILFSSDTPTIPDISQAFTLTQTSKLTSSSSTLAIFRRIA